jgi:hypothetical protein
LFDVIDVDRGRSRERVFSLTDIDIAEKKARQARIEAARARTTQKIVDSKIAKQEMIQKEIEEKGKRLI